MQSKGVLGTVTLSQRTQFNPTWLEFNLTSLNNDAIFSAGCKIHELPADPYYAGREKCSTTGPVFNPVGVEKGRWLILSSLLFYLSFYWFHRFWISGSVCCGRYRG